MERLNKQLGENRWHHRRRVGRIMAALGFKRDFMSRFDMVAPGPNPGPIKLPETHQSLEDPDVPIESINS